jgi:hypothetical protein
MLFSPSAYFGGTAAPMAWDLTRTPAAELRVLCCGDVHPLKEVQEPAPAAYPDPAEYQDLDEQVAREQPVTQAANNRVQGLMGPTGDNPQHRLTGP